MAHISVTQRGRHIAGLCRACRACNLRNVQSMLRRSCACGEHGRCFWVVCGASHTEKQSFLTAWLLRAAMRIVRLLAVSTRIKF